MNSNQTPEPIEVDWGTPDLDNTARLVTEAVDEIRTSLTEVFAPLIAALAAVDTEAVHAIRDRLRYGDADTAETWTGPVPTEYRASPPQSTEPDEQPTRDVSDTPITVDVAEAWLIADHDTLIATGVVRPATDRARELIAKLRGPIIADVAWDLRRICRRAPGHTCGTGCDLDATAQLLEHLADELNRDAATPRRRPTVADTYDDDHDTDYPLCCEDADCGHCEETN